MWVWVWVAGQEMDKDGGKWVGGCQYVQVRYDESSCLSLTQLLTLLTPCAVQWFYVSAVTGDAMWEPPKCGYTKNDGYRVLVTGAQVDAEGNAVMLAKVEAAEVINHSVHLLVGRG